MCPNSSSCELFPLFTLKSTLKLWQIKYCESDYERCARYSLTKSGKAVPPSLLPNGHSLRLRVITKEE